MANVPSQRYNDPVPQIPHNQDAVLAHHYAAMREQFQARGMQPVPDNRFQGRPRAPMRSWLKQEVEAVPQGHPTAWQQSFNAHANAMHPTHIQQSSIAPARHNGVTPALTILQQPAFQQQPDMPQQFAYNEHRFHPLGQPTPTAAAFTTSYNGHPISQDGIMGIPANNSYSASQTSGPMATQWPPHMMIQNEQIVSQQSAPQTIVDLTEDDATPAMPSVEVARELSVPVNQDATSSQASSIAVSLPTPPQLTFQKTVAPKPAATSRKRKARDETAPTPPPKKPKEISKQKERAYRPLTAAEVERSNGAVRMQIGRIDKYAWQVEGRAAAEKKLSSSASLPASSAKGAKGFRGSDLFEAFTDSVQKTDAQRKERKKARKTQNKTFQSVEVTDKPDQPEPVNLPTPVSLTSTIDGKSSEKEPEQPSTAEQSASLNELFSGGEEEEENVNKRPSAFYPVPEEGNSDDDGGVTVEWDPKTRKDIPAPVPAPVAIPPPTKRASAPKKRASKPKKNAFEEFVKSKATKTDKTPKPRGSRGPYNTAKRRREAAAEQAAREEAARKQAEEEVARPAEGDADELEQDFWALVRAEGDANMEYSPATDLQAAPEKDGVANMEDSPAEEGAVPSNDNEGQGEKLPDLSEDEFESDEDETEEEAAARFAKYERYKCSKRG